MSPPLAEHPAKSTAAETSLLVQQPASVIQMLAVSFCVVGSSAITRGSKVPQLALLRIANTHRGNRKPQLRHQLTNWRRVADEVRRAPLRCVENLVGVDTQLRVDGRDEVFG